MTPLIEKLKQKLAEAEAEIKALKLDPYPLAKKLFESGKKLALAVENLKRISVLESDIVASAIACETLEKIK